MKKNKIVSGISEMLYKAGFQLRKHSPEILVAAGIAGTVVSAVMACKATTKLSEILDESKENIDKIHEAVNDESLREKYTPEDSKKDLAVVYIQTGIKIVKLYAPAVAVGVLSVTGILASNDILRKRNMALAAAYATVDKSFKEYRNRVIKRFGERVDKELKNGIKAVEIEETDGDKTVKKTVDAFDPETPPCSEYACFFDESSRDFQEVHEYNLAFLRAQQQYANDLLKAHGRLFLNEVYDILGLSNKKSRAGQIVGWIYDSKNPVGDNYVDFGIQELYEPSDDSDFPEDWKPVILLDFNVDGNILERIE